MHQPPRRYVRRRRGWLGQTTAEGDALTEHRPDAAYIEEGDSAPRHTRRRPRFVERMVATRALIGFSAEDEARIDATSALLLPHLAAVTEEIYRGLLSRPETAAQFRDATGAIDGAQLDLQRHAFETWLLSALADPLDAGTATYLASVGRVHVRREDSAGHIKARYLLATMSRVQALLVSILADAISDSHELGACATAWSKQLMIHLDLLLSVYAATESSARWY